MGRESHRGTSSEVKTFGCFTLELVGTKSLGTGVAEGRQKGKIEWSTLLFQEPHITACKYVSLVELKLKRSFTIDIFYSL